MTEVSIQQQPFVPDNLAPNLDLIVLRKDKQSTTAHPIAHFVSYDHLIPSFCKFVLSIFSVSIPRTYKEAIMNPF